MVEPRGTVSADLSTAREIAVTHTAAVFVFWTCAALVVYSYAVYPLVLMALASRTKPLVPPSETPDIDLPLVSGTDCCP